MQASNLQNMANTQIDLDNRLMHATGYIHRQSRGVKCASPVGESV
jgi:hypothetical protein